MVFRQGFFLRYLLLDVDLTSDDRFFFDVTAAKCFDDSSCGAIEAHFTLSCHSFNKFCMF